MYKHKEVYAEKRQQYIWQYMQYTSVRKSGVCSNTWSTSLWQYMNYKQQYMQYNAVHAAVHIHIITPTLFPIVLLRLMLPEELWQRPDISPRPPGRMDAGMSKRSRRTCCSWLTDHKSSMKPSITLMMGRTTSRGVRHTGVQPLERAMSRYLAVVAVWQ